MSQTSASAKKQTGLYKRPISELPHFSLAALFGATQFAFIWAIHNRSYVLVYSMLIGTVVCAVQVYKQAKSKGRLLKLGSLVWPAIARSLPLNIILFGLAYFKQHTDDFLHNRAVLHSRFSVVSNAALYAAVTSALIFSAWIRTGVPSWIVTTVESAAFLSLAGHIMVTTSDPEGVIDILTIGAAALATFSIRLYWGQSFEMIHPAGSVGH